MSGYAFAGRGGNPYPTSNVGNAGGGQAAADTMRENGTARGNSNPAPNKLKVPAPAAAPGMDFTFDRVSSIQCEQDVVYAVGGWEAGYFQNELKQCFDLAVVKLPGADAFAKASKGDITVKSIKYHQLKKAISTEAHVVQAELHEGDYKTYTIGDKTFTCNPNGYHFEVTYSKAWDWTFKLVAEVDLDYTLDQWGEEADLQYAAQVEVCKVPKCYRGLTVVEPDAGKKALKISFGELCADSFVPWAHMSCYLPDKDRVQKMCHSACWPREPPQESDDLPPPAPFQQDKLTGKYIFDQNQTDEPWTGGKVLCLWFPPVKKDDEGSWKALCNFTIDKVLAIKRYQDREEGPPWWRLKITCTVNSDSDVEMFCSNERPGDDKIDLTKVGVIHGEVELQPALVDDRNLDLPFSKVCAYFSCQKYFRAEHFKALLNDLRPWPRITRVVDRFCRQVQTARPDLFVFGNCCYEKGEMYTHEELGVHIMPSMFNGKDRKDIVPLKAHAYPKIVWIPQAWVRYKLLMNFWTQLMPIEFKNNLMPAKCAFAISLSHLHCSKFWEGQAVQKGVATPWLKSTAGNTGKTNILAAVNSLMGWVDRGFIMGAQSTLPAQTNRMSKLVADNTFCIDEIATKVSNKSEDYSHKLKDLVHLVYGGSTRETIGKTDQFCTTFMGTSNVLVNESDGPFLQRLLLILFDPLTGNAHIPAGHSKEWTACCDLLSCLQPDFECLLYNNKLDQNALADCCTFVQKAVSQEHARNANLWGFALYYMLMMEAFTQGHEHHRADTVFEYICVNAVRQNYMANKHTSILEQFVLSIHKVRTVSQDPLQGEDKCFYWHVFRTTERPPSSAIMAPNQTYIAIRLESALNIIKSVLKEVIKVEDIRRGMQEPTNNWATFGKAKFMDVALLGYKGCMNTVLNMESGASSLVPYEEAQLPNDSLKRLQCIFFQADKWDAVVNSVDTYMDTQADYKAVVIKSEEPGRGEYNFFESCTFRLFDADGDIDAWFGYRIFQDHVFAPYMGMSNHVYGFDDGDFGVVVGMREKQVEEGYPTVEECYKPSSIKAVYGYQKPLPETLPPCFRINPFQYRNDDGDVQMPNDDPSAFYHTHLYEMEKESTYQAGCDSPIRPHSDEWRSGDGVANDSPHEGSTRTPLSEVGGGNTPLGNQRKRIRIDDDDDEGEDLMQDDEVS